MAGCAHRIQRSLVTPGGATPDTLSPYLKAHLRGGHVYVLASWRFESGGSVRGSGVLLGPNRDTVAVGEVLLPRDSVALFETNVIRGSGANPALTVMAGVTAVIAGLCATSPKSCFGSCPTFYAPDSAGESLQAEGFSASVAPALEATDLDMLFHARPSSRDFTLRLTNEALETHVVRRADVVVARRPPGGRVFVTPGGAFREATLLTPPTRCSAIEGDCVAALQNPGGGERWSTADSTNLAAKETIDLEFDGVPAGELGLVVRSRQSLMTTYLIYQALAYMGSEVGRWLTTVGPRDNGGELGGGLGRALGLVEVLVPSGAEGWTTVGRVGETGPIAIDTKVVPIHVPQGEPVRVRLRLTRGLWRVDYVALAVLGDTVRPERIRPSIVRRGGRDAPKGLNALLGFAEPLTTMPGDEYQITYRLPPDFQNYELFLEARGYYLEWMRREWRAEESAAKAAMMMLAPEAALQALAPEYKKVEPSIEDLFWRSRYVRPR